LKFLKYHPQALEELKYAIREQITRIPNDMLALLQVMGNFQQRLHIMFVTF